MAGKEGTGLNFLWSGFSFLLFLLLRPAFSQLLQSHTAVQHNYRGNPVTSPWGLPLVLVLATTYALRILAEGSNPIFWRGLFILFVAGFLGLMDDVLGDTESRGLGGHIGAFFLKRRLTTGFVKAAMGLMAALVLAADDSGPQLLLDALTLALAMNTINLLDVRPGRAGKGFLLFLAPVMLAHDPEAAARLGLSAAAALLAYLPLDLGERAMLGDTGANALGALLGLIIVTDLALTGRLLALLALGGLHVLAAFCSLSEIIGRVSPLSALDWLGRTKK